MRAEPPSGYWFERFYLSGSNVNFIDILVCKGCGCAVGNAFVHNQRCPAPPERPMIANPDEPRNWEEKEIYERFARGETVHYTLSPSEFNQVHPGIDMSTIAFTKDKRFINCPFCIRVLLGKDILIKEN